ncbi:MAG: hypothetical protein JWL69_4014 [Phycisphaerales bacterium]|nr:hypothetical protein [Phycisphaerales bacterium]MDB5355798.1 hypothetical protein [Phycisphaerales bacterium]
MPAREDREKGSSWRSVSGLFIGASILLFLASLTQNGYQSDGPTENHKWAPALTLFLFGWSGILARVVAWFANPALGATWMLMRFRSKRLAALCCAIASLALSLSFLLQKEIMADEAGHMSRITAYGFGYWLWIASIATALAGCIAATLRDRSAQIETPVV